MAIQPQIIPREYSNALGDAQAHADNRIHESTKWIRANIPFGIAEPDGYDPFWFASKQSDIKEIALRGDLFHSGDRTITLFTKDELKRLQELMAGAKTPTRAIVNMDPPDHQKYRAVARDYFTPQNVAVLTEQVRTIAKSFARRLIDLGGECDFAKDIAFEYPLKVIMALLGVPEQDHALMLKLSQEQFGIKDDDQARGGERLEGAAAMESFLTVQKEFDAYFKDMVADRRKAPQNDIVSVLANAKIDDAPMPMQETLEYCKVTATAGHDTTSAASAGGLWGLAENPGELERLKANPAMMAGFIAEAIRHTSPSKITLRLATQDVDHKGYQIKKGDTVALGWVSGNRDEEVFEDSQAFRIDRPVNKLVAFGWGPHNCLGQHLARMEMSLLFEELVPLIRTLELAGEPKTLASLMVSGPKAVPIRYTLN